MTQHFNPQDSDPTTPLDHHDPIRPIPASGQHAPAPTSSIDSRTDQETSTADKVKDQASDLAEGSVEQAKNVAEAVKDEAGRVAAEAGDQIRNLMGTAKTEVSEQAQVQQQRVAGGLAALGEQLLSMADGAQEQTVTTDITRQAAGKVSELATWFQDRDPGAILTEVKTFARQRPGAFLAIALGAGVLAGRLGRGLAADDPEDSDNRQDNPAGDTLTEPELTGFAPTPALQPGATYVAAPAPDPDEFTGYPPGPSTPSAIPSTQWGTEPGFGR